MTKCVTEQNAATSPPKWELFIYLHSYDAFKLLGWPELGKAMGAHPIARTRTADLLIDTLRGSGV